MSIIRIGLAETENFAEGFDAIFGKKKTAPAKKPVTKKKSAKSKKRPAKRK